MADPKLGVSKDDIDVIFSNGDEIRDWHETFFESLQELIPTWSDETCIGESFIALVRTYLLFSQLNNIRTKT